MTLSQWFGSVLVADQTLEVLGIILDLVTVLNQFRPVAKVAVKMCRSLVHHF